MKIGILSMQRVPNYGSFLQAYSLKTIIESKGHKAVFVDIENKKDYLPKRKSKLLIKLNKIKYVDKYFFKRMKYSEKNKQMAQLFQNVQKKYLGIKPDKMTSEGCDTVIIGSDEIFNCSPVSYWGISGQRFGDIPGVQNVLSYAASCGYTGQDDMGEDDKALISSALKKLSNISVRDDNTRDFVKKLINKEPEMHLDPVLIYGFEKEIKIGENEGFPDYPYMVVYAYHNRINSKNEINAIRGYAKEKGLKTIAIGGSLPWCDEFAVISPFQVLAYFKHAHCIITDTFHGTVMAAKLNKSFGTIVRESNKNKLDDLLKRLKIENHKLTDINLINKVFDQQDDFKNCNTVIEDGQKRALEYLEKTAL